MLDYQTVTKVLTEPILINFVHVLAHFGQFQPNNKGCDLKPTIE